MAGSVSNAIFPLKHTCELTLMVDSFTKCNICFSVLFFFSFNADDLSVNLSIIWKWGWVFHSLKNNKTICFLVFGNPMKQEARVF